ncbi:oligosaccharide flippase family protein [Belliella marina]|uniref:Oligosaccharide flippase family protein n=1 Tax=Belliella marina TaxID=1644146 RepID=A0ABW4VKA0_9BACT
MFDKISSFPFSNLIRNKSIQNFIFLSIIQASNILITIISMPLLIQSIGMDQFGLVNLSLSVIIISNIFVSFGFNLSGPRDVAVNQGNRKELSLLISNIISGKVIIALIISVCLFFAIFGMDLFKEYQTILAFSILLLFSEATLPLWFFQGMEKMKLISMGNIFSKLIYLMGIVLFITTPEQSKWVNFLLGGSALGINILLLYYIRVEMHIIFFKPRLKEIYTSLRNNIHYFLSNLSSYISLNGGLVILSFFASSEILGSYSLSEKIIMVARMFPSLLIQSIYPNATKLYNKDERLFIKFLRRVYRRGLIISFLIAIGTFFLAPFIVLVLSKSRLEDAILYLRVLSLIPFLACLNMANVLIVLVTNQQQQLFKVSLVACGYMIIASIWLTSVYGALGVCIALLSTEAVYLFAFSALLYRNVPGLFRRYYLNTQ